MNDDDKAEIIATTIDRFFQEVDPDDFETDDLAWTIVRALNKAQARPVRADAG